MKLSLTTKMFFFGHEPKCLRCKKPVKSTHRFRIVHRRFLWWWLERVEHRCCENPSGMVVSGWRSA